MANYFDYDRYQLAVKIYQYAERSVILPEDTANLDYLKNQAAEALNYCRANHVNWLPGFQPCTGKKLAGKFQVTVDMNSDTKYGFSHYSSNAQKIHDALNSMWKKYNHQEEISTVLDLTIPAGY